MSRKLTQEQVLASHTATIPGPVGKIFNELHNEVAWLHLKWENYRALFAKNQETIDLLNEAAPSFFGNLNRMMWEDTLLHVCRLTDKPKVGGYDVLSIQQLLNEGLDQALVKSVRQQVKSAIAQTRFARDWRNRRLAHKELPSNDSQAAKKPLASASRQHMEDALKEIRAVMNIIHQHYFGSSIAYQHTCDAFDDGNSLLTVLQKGVEAEHVERRKRLRNDRA